LFVSNVKVYKFRNLADQSVELGSGPVFVTGPNGNGKTNFVEAIYLLSGSRSFRTNTSSELPHWGSQECSIFGTVTHKSGTETLGLIYTPGERKALLNGTPLESIAELLGRLRVIAFSPADLSLVKGSPSGRRKFLDRHMVDLQPSYLKILMSYQRALASKSALLKGSNVSYQQLLPWNELLVEYGGKIVENRLNFIKGLNEKAAIFHTKYAPTDGALGINLESDFLQKDGTVSFETIAQTLHNASQREIAMRSTLVGVHRDDINISLGGVDSRAYASQGQTRSVVLSLKLGVIDLLEESLGESPVVLLDDVDSELDALRSEKLFAALLEKPRQLIVTGTGNPPSQLADSRELQMLRVTTGSIEVVRSTTSS
jgi:DNA replication and repair protein RecF